MALHASADHVATISGAVEFLRDIADLIVAACADTETVQAGEALGWVSRLDFINNCLTGQNDEMIDLLRAAKIPTVGCAAGIVVRVVPLDPDRGA